MTGIEMIAYRNADKFIRELMLMRRSLELMRLDVKAYDNKLEELTQQYYEAFSEMDEADMMIVMQATMSGGDKS